MVDANDVNAKIFPRNTRTLSTYVKQTAIPKQRTKQRHRKRTFLKKELLPKKLQYRTTATRHITRTTGAQGVRQSRTFRDVVEERITRRR